MLLETIRALNHAGRAAIGRLGDVAVTAESVSQLGQGSLSFPSLGELIVQGAGVQRIRLGCDAPFCRFLAELDTGTAGRSGIEHLPAVLLEEILADVPGRRPRGSVEKIEVQPTVVRTRGVRTYGFRYVTPAGQFFMLAEIASRLEWENWRSGEFLHTMADSYLPEGWATRNAMTGGGGVENFLIFLRRTEADIRIGLDVRPAAVEAPASLIETVVVDGVRLMKLAVKVPNGTPIPPVGTLCEGHVGVGERSVDFAMRYMGRADHPVGRGAVIKCGLFTVPEGLSIVQHRANFRITLEDAIPVEVAAAAAGASATWRRRHRAELLLFGTLGDLSFTGARIVLDGHEPAGSLAVGQRIVCRLHLPGPGGRLDLDATVRRVATAKHDRPDASEECGIEFQPVDRQPPGAMERVRQFVLQEQRAWLARRLQVAGVGEW